MDTGNYNIEIDKCQKKSRFNLQLDTSLSKRGYAADSASVGAALKEIGESAKDHRSLSGRDAPNQHPISAITDLQDHLNDLQAQIDSMTTFIYNKLSPESVWTINHNLDKYPSVTIVDSSGNEVIGEVNYIDKNNLFISFSAAFSGTAYLN